MFSEEWNQYDGVMHPEPESSLLGQIWSRIRGKDHKKLVESTKIAAEAMLPRWNGFCLEKDAEVSIAEEVVEEINYVHQSFKQHFLGDDCQNQDEKPFKEVGNSEFVYLAAVKSYYLPTGSPAGDYNLHHVCVRAYVRAWVTQFFLKLLQLHIFGKLLVPMNFYALQYFLGLVNFGLLLGE